MKNTIQIRNFKTLTIFDDMIANIFSNKNLNRIVTEVFIRGRKSIISLAFTTKFLFVVAKSIRLNYTHYSIMEVSTTQDYQQLTFNISSDNDFPDFLNLFKNVLQNHIPF